jgi:hypothetical protein
VVWFGEALENEVLEKTDEVLRKCDVCLLVSHTKPSVCVQGLRNGGGGHWGQDFVKRFAHACTSKMRSSR